VRRETLLGLIFVVAACAYLLARLAPDVSGKPLHADEAVTGLVAARPFGEMLTTVLVERGGPPLHFVAAHVALVLDPSADALRWTSVAFALGTVILCYDLGRRIAGPTAGAAAALVVATSTILGQLGTLGRMYAAFAFFAALAADTFYRALEQRTARTAVVAAVAAVLVAATHPFGLFIVVAEAVAGLALWRGRPLRPALPVFAVGLLLVPVLYASLRLSDRFGVGAGESSPLSSPRAALREIHDAVAAFSGGHAVLLIFALLFCAGIFLVARQQPAFLALLAAAVAPPLVYLVVSGSGTVARSTRHLVYALPLWAALIGAGLVLLAGRFPLAVQALLLALVGVLGAGYQTKYAGDPRGVATLNAATSNPAALAGPAAWLREHVTPDDVLFQYATPYLAALDETQHATTIGPGPGGLLARGLDRVEFPASAVAVALQVAGSDVQSDELRARLEDDAEVELTRRWLVIRQPGPFANEDELLLAAADVVGAAHASTLSTPPRVEARIRGSFFVVCHALRQRSIENAECSSTFPED